MAVEIPGVPDRSTGVLAEDLKIPAGRKSQDAIGPNVRKEHGAIERGNWALKEGCERRDLSVCHDARLRSTVHC